MKSRAVVFTEAARADLLEIYEWISVAASWSTAGKYVARLERFCLALDLASERGTPREDIRPGLRLIGFERRISIIFEAQADTVYILRVFRAGRDWEAELSED